MSIVHLCAAAAAGRAACVPAPRRTTPSIFHISGSLHADRRSEGDQGSGKPRRHGAGQRARGGGAGPSRHRRAQRGTGHRHGRRRLPQGRGHDRRHRGRGVRRRRDDRQGQGAAGGRAPDAAARPDPVHLPASRAGSGTGERARRQRRGVHRLRNGHLGERRTAAARADVGSRRAHGGAGRRVLPREAAWRAGRAAGRRPGRRSGQGGRAGRRRGRHPCDPYRARHGRGSVGPRSQHRGAARAVAAVRAAAQHGLFDAGRDRAARGHRRPRDRRRADSRRVGAEARVGGADQADEARFGDRRRGDRPGRLLRDVATDDARRSRLRRRRRHALLCRQHAGRRAAHVDVRAQQRDAAVRAGACRQGLEAGAGGRSASAERTQYRVRQSHLRAGGRSARICRSSRRIR